MSNIAILPRALGTLFFYPPENELVRQVQAELPVLVKLFDWKNRTDVKAIIFNLQEQQASVTKYDFSVLLEGQGEMIAPPWGSVYQNKENIIMGDSTAAYYSFLDRVGINFDVERQPLDHFGLMLWTLAALMEEGDQVAVVELLSTHLLTWGYRYLALLKTNKQSHYYANLAVLTEMFLFEIQADIGLELQPIKLYK